MQTTHFGFQEVPLAEKMPRVQSIFSRVASRYDMMNDAMSLGLHRLWKDSFVRGLNLRAGDRLLDMAGGTGDIAERALTRFPGIHVTLSDLNLPMLSEGRARAIDRNRLSGITYANANAESLPFASASMNAYTIAFGIRNVTDISAALREAHRTLKPGGMFACLEFSDVPNEWMKRVYDFYSFRIIPKLGSLIAGDADSYQYLVESIRRFPSAPAFAKMLEEAGFKQVRFERLSGGVVAIHRAYKI